MNVALRLHSFGVDTQLLSRIGRDELGAELIVFIESRGLSTRFVQRDPNLPTGRVAVDTSDPTAASNSTLRFEGKLGFTGTCAD